MKKAISFCMTICILGSVCGCGKQVAQENVTETMPNTTVAESITETETEPTTEATTVEETTEATTESTTEAITENISEIEVTQLYKDFFEPYVDFTGSVTPQTFKEANADKLSAYDVEITEGNEEDMWKFIITDSNGDHMSIWFFPINVSDAPSDWIDTITLITYHHADKEISVNDQSHAFKKPKYNTHDKNREPKNVEVNSIEDLTAFMFGGDDFDNSVVTEIS